MDNEKQQCSREPRCRDEHDMLIVSLNTLARMVEEMDSKDPDVEVLWDILAIFSHEAEKRGFTMTTDNGEVN